MTEKNARELKKRLVEEDEDYDDSDEEERPRKKNKRTKQEAPRNEDGSKPNKQSKPESIPICGFFKMK